MANSDRCSDGTVGKVLRVLQQVEQAAARTRAQEPLDFELRSRVTSRRRSDVSVGHATRAIE